MSDEDLYEYAVQEVESEGVSKALWTKALVKSNNDEEKAKTIYIELRVKALKKEIELAQLNEEVQEMEKEVKKLKIQNAFGMIFYHPVFWIVVCVIGYYLYNAYSG